MPFLVSKRSEKRSKKYPHLLPPFIKCVVWKHLPKNWNNEIVKRFGEGKYLITKHGVGCDGYTKVFHGRLEYIMEF